MLRISGCITIILQCLTGYGQGIVRGNVNYNNGIYLYTTIDTNKCTLNYGAGIFAKQKQFIILSDTACKNERLTRWYLVYYQQKKYIAEKIFFEYTLQIDSQLNAYKKNFPDPQERRSIVEKNAEKEYQKFLKDIEEQRKTDSITKVAVEVAEIRANDSLEKEIEKGIILLREKNIVLYDWSWEYPNEYSSFVDIDVTVYNPYKSTIKYIWFTIRATNPVGDPAIDGISGKSFKTVKGVGPIDYKNVGSYKFENVFYSKVVESMRITQIKIQFFNGTIKIISNPISFGSRDE